MVFRAGLALLLFCRGAEALHAQAAPPRAPSPWSGIGQLGVNSHNSTTDAVSLLLDHTLTYLKAPASFNLRTHYQHNEMSYEGAVAGPSGTFVLKRQKFRTNSAEADARLRVLFDRRNYWVLLGQWTRNPSQGIAHRELSALGFGRNVVSARRGATMQVELVGGYLNEKQNRTLRVHYPAVGSAVNFSFPIGHTGGRLSSNNTGFGDTGGRKDWVFTSQNTLFAQLTRVFGVSVSFTASHDNKPSLAFFDPTGDGQVSVAIGKRVTDLSAALTIRW